jgi:pyrroline-5-carboxylate reductase
MNLLGMIWPRSLLLFGAGKMGAAMLEGWLKAGLSGSTVTVIDPHVSHEVTKLVGQFGCVLNPSVLSQQEVFVLAIKPQMLDMVADSIVNVIAPSTLVVSIMAGKTLANIEARMPKAQAIVRAMPNTPASVGRGITGAYASHGVLAAQKGLAQRLLEAAGKVEWLESEADIDAVTAVSGSGPAYVFYMVECLAKAGEAAGLAPDIAMRLARATIEGAGELLFQNQNQLASKLRLNVTSPNGTTAAALEVLMAEDGLGQVIHRAVMAAKQRSEQLSG